MGAHHKVKPGSLIHGNGCEVSADCFDHCPYPDGCKWQSRNVFDSGYKPDWLKRYLQVDLGHKCGQ
jgi:hypothetical protein